MLQGGDIIVGDKNFFVGENELKAIQIMFPVPDVTAVEVLSHMFQKPVLPVYVKSNRDAGDEWSFHIDLDMVLAVDRHTNKEVALIRSPEFLLNALSGRTISNEATTAELNEVRLRILKKYKSGAFGKSLATGSNDFIDSLAS